MTYANASMDPQDILILKSREWKKERRKRGKRFGANFLSFFLLWIAL
jgi:hypothetical protein